MDNSKANYGTDSSDTVQRAQKGGRPRRNDVTPAHVRELRERGLSLRQIARQLRAGYGTVRKALHRATITPDLSENPTAEAL